MKNSILGITLKKGEDIYGVNRGGVADEIEESMILLLPIIGIQKTCDRVVYSLAVEGVNNFTTNYLPLKTATVALRKDGSCILTLGMEGQDNPATFKVEEISAMSGFPDWWTSATEINWSI